MEDIQAALNTTIAKLSDQNYEKSLAFVRLWFEIGQTHSEIPPDALLGALRTFRTTSFSDSDPINPTAHLIIRFASDAESDHTLAPHSTGLRSRLCAETLRRFFHADLRFVYRDLYDWGIFHADANLVAHWINSGYVEEAAIRNRVLQSLISHPHCTITKWMHSSSCLNWQVQHLRHTQTLRSSTAAWSSSRATTGLIRSKAN